MARYNNNNRMGRGRRTPNRRNSSTRRQKARQASTQRMLEDTYGVKFKNVSKLSPLSQYMIDYCSKAVGTDEWDLFN